MDPDLNPRGYRPPTEPVNPSFFEETSMPSCGTVLASWNGTSAYSNGDSAHPPRPGDMLVWTNGTGASLGSRWTSWVPDKCVGGVPQQQTCK